MVVALSYYGISYSAGSIGDDLFVSNILIALVGKKLLPPSRIQQLRTKAVPPMRSAVS